jgi:nitric oxide reductase activation protein
MIQRRLARVGLALMGLRRQPTGADLDLDAVVDTRIDVASGHGAGRNTYRDVRRVRSDLSVLILLDASGSAAERGVGGGPLHDHQVAATATLVDALVSIGVRVAVHAFSSMGREDVRVTRLRRFDEHGSGAFRSRLGSMSPEAFTRLGAAIRHSGHVLQHESGTGSKLLVVVSDGFTHDHGYEGVYGQADAARSIEEVRSQGVGCLCLALGGTGDRERLDRVFGPAAHAVADDLSELRTDIRMLFERALDGADTRRRFAPQR